MSDRCVRCLAVTPYGEHWYCALTVTGTAAQYTSACKLMLDCLSVNASVGVLARGCGCLFALLLAQSGPGQVSCKTPLAEAAPDLPSCSAYPLMLCPRPVRRLLSQHPQA